MSENNRYDGNREYSQQDPFEATQSAQQPYQQQPYQQQPNQQPYQQQPYQQNYQQPYQQNYAQQPQPNAYGYNDYNNMPYESPEEKTTKNQGIAAMVLGIISICCCGIAAIPGLVLGIISYRKKQDNNGKALAGIILCSIGIVLWIVGIIVVASQPNATRIIYLR